MKLPLPSAVTSILSRYEAAGFEAYAVGGCVRDLLRGLDPDDFDLTTNARPADTLSLFSDCRVLETGLKHGTVTLFFEGKSYEITTFRAETDYTDGRHPDAVSFGVSLNEDLLRRDFTINAMAYAPQCGLIDLFDGREDLEKGVLRCVGEPSRRFSEDALRILRAVRFASRLSFSIEEDTAAAMLALAPRLSLISAERINAELTKALVGDGIEAVLLAYPSLFTQVIPELHSCLHYDQNNPHHRFDLFTHLAKTVAALPQDPILRMAGLLHDIGKPPTQHLDSEGISHFYGHAAVSAEMARDILTRLRFRNIDISRITTLIRYHDGVIEATETAVKRRLHRLGQEIFFDLLALQHADHVAQLGEPSFRAAHNEELFRIANTIMSNSECVSRTSLAINGHDVSATGRRGKEIGEALAVLLDAVLDGRIENEREALLRYLETLP